MNVRVEFLGIVALPSNGNLYGFSVRRFNEFLQTMNVDESVLKSCRRNKIDGKKFSRMTDQDLEKHGLLQPIIIYFRKQTMKTPNNSNFLL